MRLGDLVKQLNFGTDTEGEVFRFQTDQFKVFNLDRKEEVHNGDIISEYIFVEVPKHVLLKMTLQTGMSYFHDFQTKLLSEKFFGHKSDLRWNLYLILIVESYDQFTDTGTIQLIENDSDYARKFVMTTKDAIQWLDKAWLKNLSDEKYVNIDPILEWHNVLTNVGLTGCLTDTFSQGQVDNFLKGHEFLTSDNNSSQRRSRRNPDFDEVIEEIRTVELKGFRTHCFDYSEPLYLSKINLLHGSNGAGKTSVMEAIELAFTNEINRCSEFGDDNTDSIESLSVSCITESKKIIHFQPGKPSSFYKRLAQKWYGIPAGRQSSELNNSYHRYNFFDSEAAYRFALNESAQIEKNKFNYSDNLSRLVFGDDVIETQKNWTRYLQEFKEKSENLTKVNEKAIKELEVLQQEFSESTKHEDVQFDELDRHLKSVKLKLLRSQVLIEESTNEYLSRLSLNFELLEVPRKKIVESGLNLNILSLKYIGEQQLQLGNSMGELLLKKEELEILINNWKAEKSALDKQVYQNESLLINTNQDYQNIKNIHEQWLQIKPIIEQPDQIKLRKNLDIQEDEIIKRLEWINQLNAKHHLMDNLTERDILILSNEDYNALIMKYKVQGDSLNNLKTQLTKNEQHAGVIEAALSRIHAAGDDYLIKHENSTYCPLCTHDYGSHQMLVDAFNQAKNISSSNNEQLADLHEQIRLLHNEIEVVGQEISIHEKNSRNTKLVNIAFTDLLASHLHSNKSFDKPLIEKLNEFQITIRSRYEITSELSQVRSQISVLEESGISKQSILQAELFRLENALLKDFEANLHNNSFEDFLIEKEVSLLSKLSVLRESVEGLEKQSNNLAELIKKQSIESVEASINELKQKLQHISNINENVRLLLDDFDIENEDNLLVWSGQFQKAQSYIELFIKKHDSLKEQERRKEEMIEKEKAIMTIENYIKRCSDAINALGKLKLLRDYTQGFIIRNVSQIERFFNLLHTPREFDKLELGEDGLSLRRKWDGKTVKAYQMSSGQRASLALSVMFAIHLAAPQAPKVLMMDEPVANMDDLHLMNLLDLLRDLALSGRQIFVTTANPDVANLFRRKFSFYRERFTHFEFIRSSGEPVRIQPIHYSPFMEPSVSSRIIKEKGEQ